MKNLGLSRATIVLGVVAVLYGLIVIAKWGEDYAGWRLILLAALAGSAVGLQFKQLAVKFELLTFFKYVHLLLAVVYFWGAAFGKWAKRGDPDEGFLSSTGGTGFGILAVLLGVGLLGLAIMRIMGKTKVLPGLGVEQLTVILGIAAWMNLLAFIVGWLATFEAGTGWGVVVAYFPASLIPQLGLITLSGVEPPTTLTDLDSGKRRSFSLVAVLAGTGVALFPFLPWLTSRGVSLSALEGKAGGDFSGPRFGYILLIFGVVVAVAGLMRLRPGGLAEPGPNALIGHVLLAVGAVAVLIPLAALISILRVDKLNPGLGLWLGLLAGIALVAVAIVENRTRGAVAA